MGNNVLITGGAGFIGLALARALLGRGADVTLLDNFSRGRHDAALEALSGQVRLIPYDLTRPIDDGALGGPYDQIYHLAAIVGVRHSNERPHEVLRTNLLSTTHLLDWCASMRPTLFFSSTSEVADGAAALGLGAPTAEAVPLVIRDPLVPRYAYAASKLAGELLCINYARAHGFPVRIGRYHNVYGPRMGYDHVIPQFIERLLEQRDPFPIYGAYQFRAFCHIADAVEATLRLMEVPGAEPLIANIGNDRELVAIIDLARQLFAIAGVAPAIAIHPPPQGSPERRCPDLSQIHRLTGYQPTIDLATGLADTYAWYYSAWAGQAQPAGAI